MFGVSIKKYRTMKNKIITLILALISFSIIHGQELAGDWEGNLDVNGTQLKIVFHLVKDGNQYKSTMDSPNQGVFGYATDKTEVNGNNLKIKTSALQMTMEGTFDHATNSIEANFNQAHMTLPLKLTRVKKEISKVTGENNTSPLAGDWNGAIDIMGMKLRLIFHVTEDKGSFTSLMDSPDQSAYGLQIDETTVEENNIKFYSKAMKMTVEGEYLPDSNIILAKFSQAGQNADLRLTREEVEKEEVRRPQEPKDMDYKQEEVKFINEDGGHKLAGTLTIPKSGQFDKVAILVSGSGPQDRNEELIGHKPFLVLSDYLTRNGVAVLRYDDRGVAESEGEFKTATSDDFAKDAEAAIAFLKARKDMNGKKIGIIGHSEGGMIAPIVASRTPIDYIVLLAGPGIAIDVLLDEQSRAISKVSEVSAEAIEFNSRVSKLLFDYMKKNKEQGSDEMKLELEKIFRSEIAKVPEDRLEEFGNPETMIETQVETLTLPWFRYFIDFHPKDYLEKVTCPVLAINGELDLQVLPDSNLDGIDKALKAGGNENYMTKELPKLNHLFQTSETGSPSNYGKIEETFNEDAMKLVLNWLNNFDA